METKELKNGLSIIELEERHEMAVAPTIETQINEQPRLGKCDNRCTPQCPAYGNTMKYRLR